MSALKRADSRAGATPFRIAVAYICDANYHDITMVSLASVARSHASPLAFFFLQSGYRREAPPSLLRLVRSRGHTLEIIEAPSFTLGRAPKASAVQHQHITDTALSKVLAIEMLSRDHDYILYVDGDILAFGDLHCEEHVGFSAIAGACLDLSIGTGLDDPLIRHRCEAAGLSPYYFNSGVMMINAARWRETRAFDRFAENFEIHREHCPYLSACPTHDQCVFNMTFGWETLHLPIALNVQKSAMHTAVWDSALVRHYTGPRKFLPVRYRTCDRREFALLKAISREAGLRAPGLHDFGLSNRLNAFRRRATVAAYEEAIRAVSAAYPQIAPAISAWT
jgi:lipopolysaccharide biosynthesis glycosyltransferase